MDAVGWLVTAVAVLLTGISKAGLGGALGGLAVPLMALWISPRDAVAVMLPILMVMDVVGLRVWWGKADLVALKVLIPGALLGIVIGTLTFEWFSEDMVKLIVGVIAIVFALNRLLRKGAAQTPTSAQPRLVLGALCGVGAGFTSTLAHNGGPPLMAYLLSRTMSKEAFVATSVFFFLAINFVKLPFYLGIGLFRSDTLWMSLVLMPLIPVGVWLGIRLVHRIPERPFFLFATWAMGLSGVMLVWTALG